MTYKDKSKMGLIAFLTFFALSFLMPIIGIFIASSVVTLFSMLMGPLWVGALIYTAYTFSKHLMTKKAPIKESVREYIQKEMQDESSTLFKQVESLILNKKNNPNTENSTKKEAMGPLDTDLNVKADTDLDVKADTDLDVKSSYK